MDDFKRIFERMDIQQIRTFLLCGAEDFEVDSRRYEQRLKQESEPMYKRIESLYPGGQEWDDFLAIFPKP